jgi:hypothetical protein
VSQISQHVAAIAIIDGVHTVDQRDKYPPLSFIVLSIAGYVIGRLSFAKF